MTPHTRLMRFAPDPDELSESDALARLADETDARLLAATPELPQKAKQHHPPRIPEEVRLEVLRLRGKGDSYQRIAAATGIDRGTVQRICARAAREERDEQ